MRFPLFVRQTIAAAGLCALAVPALAQVVVTDPPPEHHFGQIPVGATYAAQYFSVFNQGSSPVTLGQVRVDGQMAVCAALGCPTVAPEDFTVQGADGCSGQTLQPGLGCSTLVGFVPTAPGARVARLVFAVQDGAEVERLVAGTGVSQPLECVLDWAERSYPALFSQPTPTQVVSPYVARCYQGGALCVGADVAVPTVAPASIYYLFQGQMGRLGALSDFATVATQAPPSTLRCDQSSQH
ncbi:MULTISPECIES: hypothetical protein [Giesbergeria]|uniref:Uncharacterized protein n=1 Tax=Giesbergeria sinuosa TaxID=80883 RepID=A0ABV9QKA3_9BURK